MTTHRRLIGPALALLASAGVPASAQPEPAELPPFDQVSKGYEKVVSTQDGTGLYTLYRREKDQQLLAELPKDFEGKRLYIVPTIAEGDEEAGVYMMYTRWGAPGDRYVYWTRFNNSLAMIEPNLAYRSSGDAESKSSTKRVFTDQVVLDVPVLTTGPGGGPVIDLDAMLLQQSPKFFGWLMGNAQFHLAKFTEVKAFPQNIEVSVQLPVQQGRLVTLHYSLSLVQGDASYKPREADRRVGFFYTNYTDRAKNDGDSQTVRYANRWNLEKADPSLKLSPPKKPIVYYIEHTTPVRYRRWVREGILAWNAAFEKCGISNAIEVYQQDAATGAHMDKDPEDVRYNFLRWTNSHMGYAIGPSRVNPETGQILDCDVVMDEGFLSGWAYEYNNVYPEAATVGFDGETLSWLDANPDWDPRLLMAPPGKRASILAERAAKAAHPAHEEPARTLLQQTMLGARRPCTNLRGMASNVAMGRMAIDADFLAAAPADAGADLIDNTPEWFIGPALKDIIMHEVGHTMGLMHNMKASSIYSYEQINSPEWKGKKPLAGSVMDYLPTNIASGGRERQGDLVMIDIGPYDFWAIEWGYTAGDPKDVAKRSAEPELAFLADEGISGPDIGCKVWDLGSDSLGWAKDRVKLCAELRAKILTRVVKDGQSWQKAREAYMMLLGQQAYAYSITTMYLGAASVHRDRKGDPNARDPYVVVPVEQQRAALTFILENAFRVESFGFTPELLAKLGTDQWWDEDSFGGGSEPDWPFTDMALGMQASVLTRLMNPMTLRRVLDNELRTPAGQDALTMPELLAAVRAEIWSELASASGREYSARQPMIATVRRNLQREHLNRLVALSTSPAWGGASSRPLTNLARQELREIKAMIEKMNGQHVDPYTKAHLADANDRITRALDAGYIRTN